jgi:hypothetical protein
MITCPLLVLSAMLFLAAPLAAADCPVARSGDAISDTLEKAPSCDAAQKLFEACAYVASIDSMFGSIVTGKCENDFLAKLNASQRKTYDRQKDACSRKYAKQEGAMYRSFEAMCISKLAAGYSKRFAASPKGPADK